MLLMVPGDSEHGFCAETASIWQLIGVGLRIFMIIIPIVLIILGVKDLGQAVVSNEEKQINKTMKKFGIRVVAAVAIFFVPNIIGYLFTLIGGFTDAKDDYRICSKCIAHPLQKGKQTDTDTCQYYIDHSDGGASGVPKN